MISRDSRNKIAFNRNEKKKNNPSEFERPITAWSRKSALRMMNRSLVRERESEWDSERARDGREWMYRWKKKYIYIYCIY